LAASIAVVEFTRNYGNMGYSRRREARDIADAIDESNRRIAGVTLGVVCSANIVMLEVACHSCPRRGRYRLTRLIDRYGAGMELPELKQLLSADCPRHANTSFYNRCAVYFPGWKPKA
jgi:hypothetical protein